MSEWKLCSLNPVEQFNMDLNEVHDALIQRTIALSEAEMARMGNGSPSRALRLFIVRQRGREEQTLSSDQDSGFIYEDPEDANKLDDNGLFCRYSLKRSLIC